MSLISDVTRDFRDLRISGPVLKKFGLTVGSVFLLFASAGYIKTGLFTPAVSILGSCGTFLILSAIAYPPLLRGIYKPWMIFALSLGWIVSRVLILIVFYCILTPTAIVARLSGHRFLDLKFQAGKRSTWIAKKSANNIEKIY